ncbi:MAG TPA: type II 3-dehydroquinate dehydratase [Gemmatimonadales bacterium]|nr:type II 3-dehydroquinate dehydratase [Gemmatimonadales bacterium]
MRLTVLNGPNLNLLGTREPEIYGTATLGDLERAVRERARELGAELDWQQTNEEGRFVELVQGLAGRADGALINAAAFTHSSLAIRDALLAVRIPFVEVHLSNIFAREPERRRSVLADLAVGIVAGFGGAGYLLALEALVRHLKATARRLDGSTGR